jgi:capsular exopolysaccharide synthesis family protein
MLLQGLRSRWRLATLLALPAALAATALVYYLLPPAPYVAQALLQVSSHQPKLLYATSDAALDFASYQRSQVALIKGRMVIQAALKDPAVAALRSVQQQRYASEWLQKRLEVDFTIGPEILRIALSGEDPEELAPLVNAVAAAYLREVVNREQSRRADRLEQLKRYHAEYAATLQARQAAFRTKATAAGATNSEEFSVKHRITLEQLATETKELSQFQSELRKVEAELKARRTRARTAREAAPLPGDVEELVNKDYLIQQYITRELALRESLAGLERIADKERYPPYAKKVEELAGLQKTMDERRKELRPIIAERLREKTQAEMAAGTEVTEQRVVVLQELEKLMSERIRHISEETKGINESALDLEALRQDISQTESLTKKAAGELEALRVEVEAPSRVTLLEDAEIPHSREDKRRGQLAALAGGSAFCLVLLAFAWAGVRARRVSSTQDVVEGLGLRVFGALPALPWRARRRMPRVTAGRDFYWHNLMIASVDATSTMLLYTSHEEDLRVLMVTSAHQGEGKTMVASHLAASFARAGRKTLLVDFDLHKAALNRVFDLPLQPGLRELLAGEAKLGEVIRPTILGGLFVLLTERWDGSALRVLTQEGIGQLFGQLKSEFDYIIVDSAPILPVADSLLIGRHVDAVLFSILRDVSSLPAVHLAQQRLAMLGVRILGAVVSGASSESYGYGYSYSYSNAGQNSPSIGPPEK